MVVLLLVCRDWETFMRGENYRLLSRRATTLAEIHTQTTMSRIWPWVPSLGRVVDGGVLALYHQALMSMTPRTKGDDGTKGCTSQGSQSSKVEIHHINSISLSFHIRENIAVLHRCALCGQKAWRERGFGLIPHFNNRGHLIAEFCDQCHAGLFHSGRGDPPFITKKLRT